MPPTQQQQIDALKAEVAALKDRQDKADTMREQTHAMVGHVQSKVDDMHQALMEPPPFDPDQKSLIARMVEITVNIEAGQRTANNVLGALKWLSGLILAAGIIYAAWRTGHVPKE
jgi:hypothetical protein